MGKRLLHFVYHMINESQDHPAHPCSLIRVFASLQNPGVLLMKIESPGLPADFTDEQGKLSLY